MKFSTFFSKIQESPWYRLFLNPVIDEISPHSKLLDIGTGTGKLIQIVSLEKGVDCIGVDTNNEMLKEAQVKLKGIKTTLLKVEPDTKFPFKNNQFDNISICNVLFHLEKKSIDYMLDDALRLLKDQGNIIILTPTSKGNFFTLSKNYFSLKNLGIYVWFYATRNKANSWSNENYLRQYAHKNKLHYKLKTVMNGFAQLEIISTNFLK